MDISYGTWSTQSCCVHIPALLPLPGKAHGRLELPHSLPQPCRRLQGMDGPAAVHRDGGTRQFPTCTVRAQIMHEEKSFLLTLISLYANIQNFKLVVSRKYWIKNSPMFAYYCHVKSRSKTSILSVDLGEKKYKNPSLHRAVRKLQRLKFDWSSNMKNGIYVISAKRSFLIILSSPKCSRLM